MIHAVELYLLHFKPGGELASASHSPHTEEVVTALEGRIEIAAGDQTRVIEPYESVYYSADQVHCIRNVTRGKPAKAYLAVRYQ
jgi:quercetin dioxygenase-like cupin family protein